MGQKKRQSGMANALAGGGRSYAQSIDWLFRQAKFEVLGEQTRDYGLAVRVGSAEHTGVQNVLQLQAVAVAVASQLPALAGLSAER